MARVIPVAELATMDDGEPIMVLRGVLTKVYDRSSGTNSNGDWSLQGAVLKDKTGETPVKFNGFDDQKHLKGKEVLLECTKSSKGAFTGVKIKDDEWKGKITRYAWVTASANVGLAEENGNGNGHSEPQPQPRQQEPQSKQTSSPKPPWEHPEPPTSDKSETVKEPPRKRPEPGSIEAAREVEAWATQLAHLQVIAITKVEKYVVPMLAARDIRLDSGQQHAWAMNLAMQLEIEMKAMWRLRNTEYALPKGNGKKGSEPPYEPGQEG
jgi:hypothetical protein